VESVEVWVASLDSPRLDGGACSDGEHDRVARFADPLAAARWRAARHLLRLVIGERVGRDPRRLVFAEGPHGKPSVDGVEFSLAHSAEVAVIAVAGRAVGVDVEVPRRLHRPTGIARRLGVAEDTGPEDLLRLWTRTEALVKATGDGASAGLARVEVRLGHAGWTVRDLDLDLDAVGAVAARGTDWTVSGPRHWRG